MKLAVIDTSALLRSLIPTDCTDEIRRVLVTYDPLLLDLVKIETASALAQARRADVLSKQDADRILDALVCEFQFQSTDTVLSCAIDLAVEHSHGVYDCLFVALALKHEAVLVTADKKLARKFGPALKGALINLYDMPETLP